MIFAVVLIIVLVLLGIYAVSIYNKLVGLKNRTDSSWAQIEVQLQRRFDLIPNLVETVKGYASHESGVLEAVTAARASASKAITSGKVSDARKAEQDYQAAKLAINAVSEAYPDLKASENFRSLQEELVSTENKVAAARQFYNDSVMVYRTELQSFPNNVIAGFGRFPGKDLFEVDAPAVREAPKVQF
jgi:LemA protein